MSWWMSWLLTLSGAVGSGPAATPCEALELLDARRSVAYAVGSSELLASVYTPGSSAGDEDARVLDSYRDRGLVVVGAQMEMLSCSVSDRSAHRVELAVVDRLGRAVAMDTEAGEVSPLPRDRATERVVTLVRHGSQWRIHYP